MKVKKTVLLIVFLSFMHGLYSCKTLVGPAFNDAKQAEAGQSAEDVTSPVVSNQVISVVGVTETSISVLWIASTDEQTPQNQLLYRLYYATVGNLDTVASIEQNGTPAGNDYTAGMTYKTISGLTSGTTYYLNVIVKDSNGNKAVYQQQSRMTMADIKSPEISNTLLDVSSVSYTGLSLSWSGAVDNVTPGALLQYKIVRSLSNNISSAGDAETNGVVVSDWAAGFLTYNAVGLSQGTSYYFNVLVKDGNGNKSVYAAIPATTLVSTDTSEPSLSSAVITPVAIDCNQLSLNWTKATDNITAQANLQYLVYYSQNSALNSVNEVELNGIPVGIYQADISARNITGLTASTTYYFNIIVVDEVFNKRAYSKLTQTTTADTTAPVPGLSGQISVSSVTQNSLLLNWTLANDNYYNQITLRYKIVSSLSNNISLVATAESNGTIVQDWTPNISVLVVNSLNPYTTYYFTVLVKDDNGNKAVYNSVAQQMQDTTQPVAGASGLLSVSSVNTTSLSLNWTKASDNGTAQTALQYKVLRSLTSNIDTAVNAETNGILVQDWTTDINSVAVTGLSAGSGYYLNVLVKDLAGNKSVYAQQFFNTLYNYTWQTKTVNGSMGRSSWQGIASSADGSKLAAIVNGGYIYTSTDSGVTWTQQISSGSRAWWSIASSSDGTRLAATVYNGYIYTSTDSGVTWTERTSAGLRFWYGIASSSDGTKLAALDKNYGYVYTSSDSGISWVARTGSGQRYWYRIAMSDDGVRLAAVAFPGYILTSDNSGATWTQQTVAGSRDWSGIASSADGMKLTAVVYYGYIYTSGDYGATWTEVTAPGVKYWNGVSLSADGVKQAVCSNPASNIYSSTDSGATWTAQTASGARTWGGIALSSDGSKAVAAVNPGFIYTSVDSAVNWTERTTPGTRSWAGLAASIDGVNLAAAIYSGYIYTSSDSGATWTERTASGLKYWQGIASSNDGTKLAAIVKNSYIFTSADSGATWTQRTASGSKVWQSVTSSADGTKLAAAVNNEYIYTSADSGTTWTAQTVAGTRVWMSLASSATGTKLAAVVNGGYIYSSSDSGVTWTEQTVAGSRAWQCITSSADGVRLAAAVSNGYVYTSGDSGNTWTQQTASGTRSWYSIASSSDGTKLTAAVNGGYVYTSIDGGISWTEQTAAGSRYWQSVASSADGNRLTLGTVNEANPVIGQ